MRAERVLQVGQLPERDRQLELGVDVVRIARERRPGIGRRLLDQGLLVHIGAEISGFHQHRPGGEREAFGARQRARQGGGAGHVALLVACLGLVQPSCGRRCDRSGDHAQRD